eukprot:5401165-Pleurochrysis_carterae.AAC.1
MAMSVPRAPDLLASLLTMIDLITRRHTKSFEKIPVGHCSGDTPRPIPTDASDAAIKELKLDIAKSSLDKSR